MVGDDVFAARIETGADDYRYATRQGSDVEMTACALPPDILARIVANALTELEGWRTIVENKPGAVLTLGIGEVLKHPADGHTLFLANGTNAVNATLFEKLSFDFVRDTAAVASINRIPVVLTAHL